MKRKAHATLDTNSRIIKAKKIEILLDLKPSKNILNILEIGCGSGGIAHYFATHTTIQCNVSAVDIHDNRVITDHYNFTQVESVELPFKSNNFDLVITNHVIEHVGNTKQQLRHLQEIQRVLLPNGQCYLAVPNRWMLTEPHYGLKFLSWLPRSYRSLYLNLCRKGDYYDCEPLRLFELENLLAQVNIKFENISVDATRVTLALERPNSLLNKLVQKLPNQVLAIFKPIIPTLIYKITAIKNDSSK